MLEFGVTKPKTTPQLTGEGGQFGVNTRQWIRAAKVSLGDGKVDLNVSDLSCDFEVRKPDVPAPDYARVIIRNLKEATALDAMAKEYMLLTIEAGFQGRSGVIFKGQVAQKRKGKDLNGTDKYFEVLATGNQQAYGFARVNKTLAAGHTFKDVVDEATKSFTKFGVKIGHIADLGSRKMPRAGVYFGMSRDILRDVAFATNTSWAIQDEVFQMVKNDGYLPGEAKVLNSNTGMIGLPEQTLQGIVVRCLIDSGMKYGARVHINESSIQRAELDPSWPADGKSLDAFNKSVLPGIAADGIYKVTKVEHEGETKGNPWYTTLTCIAVGDQTQAAGEAERAVGQFPFRGVSEVEDRVQGQRNQ